MYCKVGRGLKIKILDSLNFLNMPLDNLPKSFALKEMKKGYFCKVLLPVSLVVHIAL